MFDRIARAALIAALLPATASWAQETPAPAETAPEAAADAAPEAATKDVDVDSVLATVGGTDITVGHMLALRAQLPESYNQFPPSVLFPGLLDQLVQQEALAQSLEGDLPKRYALAVENEDRSMRAAAAIEAYMAGAVSDDDVKAAYDAQYADAQPTTEYHAAHILVETEEEAAELKTQIDGGAEFAAMAREHSTGPTGPSGGDLGWFGPGQMVPQFEEAVAAMEPGQVSDPVQTQFGWHLINLIETRQQEVPTLEEARPAIEQQLQQDAVQLHIDEMVENAEVDRTGSENVDPAVINDFSLLE